MARASPTSVAWKQKKVNSTPHRVNLRVSRVLLTFFCNSDKYNKILQGDTMTKKNKIVALGLAACMLSGCTAKAAASGLAQPVPSHEVQLNSHPRSYSYDGWQTDWISSGQYAWLTVISAKGVIPRTQDFVAVRMMAKVQGPNGVGDKWLEIGYTTNGMTGGGTYVYTYDTGTGEWHFYPQYPLRENMQIEVGLFANGPVWDAWLKYDGTWFKINTCKGPGQQFASFEYYVETHYDKGDSNHVHITPPRFADAIDRKDLPPNAR